MTEKTVGEWEDVSKVGQWEEVPKEKSFGEKYVQPVTDVVNRALVAGTIGAPVDIATMAMRPFGYKVEEPVGGSEWIGKQMEKAGMVTPTRRPIAELATGLAPAVVGLGTGAGKALKGAVDYYQLSKGKEAEELAKALRTKMTGTAADVVETAKKAQVAPEKRLGEIGAAQEQLGAREALAGPRQAAREKAVDDSLNQISKQKGVLAEDVGSVIQPEGQKNVAKLKKAREEEAIEKIKDPAFKDARTREAKGDYISTNPRSSGSFGSVINEIEQQISRTPEPYASELRRRFAAIKGREIPLSAGEMRAAQVRAVVEGKDPETVGATKFEPMTMDQAEFLRRMLNNKEAFKVEGFQALDVVRQNRLADVITEAMTAYEPRVGAYMEKYRDLSVPITKAIAGRAKALTEVEMAAEENALFAADKAAATKYFLDGSQERAQRLVELVGGKPEKLNNAIRGFFRSEMDGMSASQAENFVRRNEGLFRVFPELRSPMNKVVEAKRAAETMGVQAGKRAEAATTRLAGEAKRMEGALKVPKETAEKYQIFANQIDALTPKDSIGVSKQMINQLRKDNLIGDDAHRQLLGQIEQIHTKYGESAQAKQNIQLLLRKTLIYSGMGGAGIAGYYGLKAFGE